jgi:two-component system sensor histidine kinase BaeS
MPSSPADRRTSLTRRLVLLAAVVALASSVLTALVLTRALVASNRETAAATLVAEADTLAALVSDGRTVRAVRKLRTLDDRPGWAAEVVDPGAAPSAVPFTVADVAEAADGAPVAERVVDRTDWLVVSRPADARTVVVARKLSPATRLSPVQRRRALLGALLGLAGGAAAGFALALTVTRPLGRLAAAARRLSAGERDVTVPPEGPAEVADVAEALDALSRALTTSEQRQRQFLLAVSHELRTPLTAVAGYAEALADRALPPAEVPAAAEVIVTEAGRLRRRVEDLLALARLEADDFRINPARVDVAALVRAAAAAVVPRASAAGVRLSVEAPDAGPVVVTDGERLRQAIDALADNALKVLASAAPAGAPLVVACRELAGGWVRVEVRDGGPGLPPEDLAVAFERGRLTERYRGTRPVGSGVGLALVGELARRLGGHADAAPACEGGVCFGVTLPPTPPRDHADLR